MIFLWLSPLYILTNAYYIYEICKWLTAVGNAIDFEKKKNFIKTAAKTLKIIFAVCWSVASLSIYMGFLLPSKRADGMHFLLPSLKRIFKVIGNYHLGIFIYMGMAFIVVLTCRFLELIICKICKKKLIKDSFRFNIRRSVLGLVYVSFVICITLIGVHQARDIKTNSYEITVHKSAAGHDSLKIVLVADLHLGYNIGCAQMEKMVTLINNENPDLVIVAGDIFDNEYEALDDPEKLVSILSSVQSKYGVYAVYGNHDVSERIIGGFTFNYDDPQKGSSDEMDKFVERCGFNLLMDEYALIYDSFYIYGRPDYIKPGKTIDVRKTPSEIASLLDMTKPVIVIDHEPRELSELANAGIDIDLCGHTHDGQFFPMNITSRYLTWENSAGLLIKKNMSNIVTSGVGLFGPNIRIGTDAEICSVVVSFE